MILIVNRHTPCFETENKYISLIFQKPDGKLRKWSTLGLLRYPTQKGMVKKYHLMLALLQRRTSNSSLHGRFPSSTMSHIVQHGYHPPISVGNVSSISTYTELVGTASDPPTRSCQKYGSRYFRKFHAVIERDLSPPPPSPELYDEFCVNRIHDPTAGTPSITPTNPECAAHPAHPTGQRSPSE